MVAAGELLEHATVFGNSYGTPRRPIEAALAAGRDIVTDIDWQGTQQLSQAMPEDLVKVFVLPPSIAALRDRLQRRAQDSAEIVAARMAKSAEEMSHWPEYDYVIVNRDIDESVAEVAAIVTAERRRRTRQLGLAEFVNRLRLVERHLLRPSIGKAVGNLRLEPVGELPDSRQRPERVRPARGQGEDLLSLVLAFPNDIRHRRV